MWEATTWSDLRVEEYLEGRDGEGYLFGDDSDGWNFTDTGQERG